MEISGILVGRYDHHAVIGLPSGSKFEVPIDALVDRGRAGLALSPEAEITHVFPSSVREGLGSGLPVLVPEQILMKLAK